MPPETASSLETLRLRVTQFLNNRWGDMWQHNFGPYALRVHPRHLLEEHYRRLMLLLRDELGIPDDAVQRLLQSYADYAEKWEARHRSIPEGRLYS